MPRSKAQDPGQAELVRSRPASTPYLSHRRRRHSRRSSISGRVGRDPGVGKTLERYRAPHPSRPPTPAPQKIKRSISPRSTASCSVARRGGADQAPRTVGRAPASPWHFPPGGEVGHDHYQSATAAEPPRVSNQTRSSPRQIDRHRRLRDPAPYDCRHRSGHRHAAADGRSSLTRRPRRRQRSRSSGPWNRPTPGDNQARRRRRTASGRDPAIGRQRAAYSPASKRGQLALGLRRGR